MKNLAVILRGCEETSSEPNAVRVVEILRFPPSPHALRMTVVES